MSMTVKSFFSGFVAWHKGAFRKVLQVFGPALRSLVAQEAAQYAGTILGLVVEAERRGGTGREKYDYVMGEARGRLSTQFKQTPDRVIDFAIHMAVAQISE